MRNRGLPRTSRTAPTRAPQRGRPRDVDTTMSTRLRARLTCGARARAAGMRKGSAGQPQLHAAG
eukprot:3560923-Lingulodinium_polyedra.AAC.1